MRLHLLTVAWHLLSAFKGGDEKKPKKNSKLRFFPVKRLLCSENPKEGECFVNIPWLLVTPPISTSYMLAMFVTLWSLCLEYLLEYLAVLHWWLQAEVFSHTRHWYLDLLGWKHACLLCLVSLWHENHFVPHLFGIFLSLFLISSAS